jgi:general secretion pathway protein L
MTLFANKAASLLSPAFTALQGQWQASVFPRFFAWWGQQLCACLPSRLRAWLTRRDQPRLLRWDHDRPWMLGNQGWEPLAPGAFAGNSDCVLLLGNGQALVRTLGFPAGAARDLNTAVSFELDRYTPFKGHQVYHTVKRLPARPGQAVAVTLAVTRREALDAMLRQLKGHGIEPTAVDVALPGASASSPGLGLDLLPPQRRVPRAHRQPRINAALSALAVVLAAVSGQVWLHDRTATLEAMQQEVARLRADAKALQGLRQQLQNGQGAAQYLARRKQATPPLSLVLSELTQCLPLDTWLNQLSVDADGQVTLAGQSAHAGTLIGALKGCPSVTSPQFQGVIQPDETTGKERFYLLARLNKEERPDASAP